MSLDANTWHQFRDYLLETSRLASIRELLEWDERTYLPQTGGEFRAEQVTLLSTLIHRRMTAPCLRDWLDELSDSEATASAERDQVTTVRQIRREVDKQSRVPESLVGELSRATIRGQQIWVEARKGNRYGQFAPQLARIVELKQQEAESLGYEGERYDALIDHYEPNAKTESIAEVLSELTRRLVPLIEAIRGSKRHAPVEILKRHYPIDRQREFGRQAAAAIGFDFARGRLDETHHPFCTSLGPDDCRITTRFDERFFSSAFFGILHEAGHGIYDQGLRSDQYGLPPGTYCSLGVHESQSRLYENFVGRSSEFWRWLFPKTQQLFSESLTDVNQDDFVFAINDVRPSLIRVEADEATYNLHIVIRFELERALIQGNLSVDDLPAAWNEKYRQYLGIMPSDDATGVLQDIHWSAGLFGYFPTYSLGNLYAAQLFQRADRDLNGVTELISQGDFTPLKEWLRQHVHTHGQHFPASELMQQATGQPLQHEPLIDHLRNRLGPLYEFA